MRKLNRDSLSLQEAILEPLPLHASYRYRRVLGGAMFLISEQISHTLNSEQISYQRADLSYCEAWRIFSIFAQS